METKLILNNNKHAHTEEILDNTVYIYNMLCNITLCITYNILVLASNDIGRIAVQTLIKKINVEYLFHIYSIVTLYHQGPNVSWAAPLWTLKGTTKQRIRETAVF